MESFYEGSGGWPRFRVSLARGYGHPRAVPANARWSLGGGSTTGIARVLQAILAVARGPLPSELAGTRLDPVNYTQLGEDVAGLFELLDQADQVVDTTAITQFASKAPQLVEPYLVKLLAACDSKGLIERARKPGARFDLTRLLHHAAEVGRWPFDPHMLDLSEENFREAAGGARWSVPSWCLWEVMGARIAGSHAAPTISLRNGLQLLESTVVVLGALAESAMDVFEVGWGSLPPGFRGIRLLGTGGMGRVFEAEEEATGQRRAVKVLHRADLGTKGSRADILREASILARISDPRVVRYYEVREFDSKIALVTALVSGPTLQQEIDERERPLEERDAVNTTDEVLAALEVIHANEVIHRDVKPSNFVRTPQRVVAIDFGLARPSNSDATQTRALGSFRYAAPEQHEGRADRRSDIFAAGRLLFALLRGRPPNHDAEPLSCAERQVGPALCAIYERATARDPAARYQTVEAMRAALEGVLRRTTRTHAVPALESLAPGMAWGAFQIETKITTSRSTTLARARRCDVRAARAKQIWIHHELATEESHTVAALAAALMEVESHLVQQAHELVDHPSIAIVLEDLPADSLATRLKGGRHGQRIPITTSVCLAASVAAGLAELDCALARHLKPLPRSFIRARLWPPAIRLTSSDSVSISAFELFRELLDAHVNDDSTAKPPSAAAHIRYMSPEALAPGADADFDRAMSYGVALILWECLVGAQAFNAMDPERLVADIRKGGLASPTERGCPVPASLEALLMKMLSPDPAARPLSLDALSRRLRDEVETWGRNR